MLDRDKNHRRKLTVEFISLLDLEKARTRGACILLKVKILKLKKGILGVTFSFPVPFL
jgi:hypothetical protein